jgi:hypothetical protein
MLSDLAQGPPLILIFSLRRVNWASPYDSIDVVFLAVIYEVVPSWIKSTDFLTLNQVQWIDTRCTMTMRPNRINVAKKRGIFCSI